MRRLFLSVILFSVILFASLAFHAPAFACSCMWAGPFSRVALGQEVVVLAEVLSHYRNSIEARVLQVPRGVEARRRIRIWGDNGALCRPYVSGFRNGTTWLLAISSLPEKPAGDSSFRHGFYSTRGNTEYAISVCGDFWLEVRGGRAIGRITVSGHSNLLEWAPLEDVLAWLRSNGRTRLSPVPLSTPSRAP